jgi:hypothetical protein
MATCPFGLGSQKKGTVPAIGLGPFRLFEVRQALEFGLSKGRRRRLEKIR